ncbi:MAG: potassium channel family protein [Bacteroidales bacterium]
MILPVIISIGIIIVTIFIHGYGTIRWVVFMQGNLSRPGYHWSFNKAMYTVSYTAIVLMMMHFLEIAIWAVAYLALPEIKNLASFEEAIYFSLVTYTTVGYGDITLVPRWRIMCGFEAMNGILLFGWSTTLFFAILTRILGELKGLKSIINKKDQYKSANYLKSGHKE